MTALQCTSVVYINLHLQHTNALSNCIAIHHRLLDKWSISNAIASRRQCVHKFSIAIARSGLCAGNLDDCCQYHCLCKRNCIVDIASVTCVHYLVDNIAQLFAIIYTVLNTLQSCAAIKYRLDIFLNQRHHRTRHVATNVCDRDRDRDCDLLCPPPNFFVVWSFVLAIAKALLYVLPYICWHHHCAI